MGRQAELTTSQWVQVVVVAGIGTVLEWFDFYCYTQLNATLEKVFFPTTNETIQALSFWGVYAAAFVVRPLGGIVFGHIGDTQGRNRCLLISIVCMALSTVAIGSLPTYDAGPYKAGIAASILLALLRLVQGLAMGGEFGSAVIYVSELARPGRRGLFVAMLQLSAHAGMVLATLLVMALQNSLTEYQMLVWGWRIPFLCAFATAMLGAVLRKGMPEPHAFLTAARASAVRRASEASGRTSGSGSGTGSGGGASADLAVDIVSPRAAGKAEPEATADLGADGADGDDEEEKLEASNAASALAALHGNSNNKTPIMRLVRNNWLGLLVHVAYMAWVSGAFYVTVSWLAKDLRTYHYPLIQTQGMVIVSLMCNAVGLLGMGAAFDRGARAIASNAAITAVGALLGFAVFYGVGRGLPVAWGVVCAFHFVIGIAMANVGLPCTRVYEPLERTTGFSLGYNCGYGILGGLSPLAVSAIKASMPHGVHALAPAVWLAALALLTFVGCGALQLYAPRLGRSYVNKIQ